MLIVSQLGDELFYFHLEELILLKKKKSKIFEFSIHKFGLICSKRTNLQRDDRNIIKDGFNK